MLRRLAKTLPFEHRNEGVRLGKAWLDHRLSLCSAIPNKEPRLFHFRDGMRVPSEGWWTNQGQTGHWFLEIEIPIQQGNSRAETAVR
jgi:hypothetical protein